MWRREGTVLAAFLLLAAVAGGPPARAADTPLYDQDLARTRFLQPGDMASTQLYLNFPVYLEFPAGQQSFSTPTAVGSMMYQYTYDETGRGYLYAIPLRALAPGSQIQYRPVDAATTVIDAGMGGSWNYAAGQDSLASLYGYQAIGVGQDLYTWPQGEAPASLSASGGQSIWGNAHNGDFQVDMGPLVTPAVPVAGTDLSTGKPVTWQSPLAVVGSWDGGLIAYPAYMPPGDIPDEIRYATTQEYPDPDVALTSDPVWLGDCAAFGGDPTVAFGVADPAHPRIVLLDVATGAYKSIGAGEIAYPVADTVVYDARDGELIAQDSHGVLYAFALAGRLLGIYDTWRSQNLILGQDMSLSQPTAGQEALYAIGHGGDQLGQFDPQTLAPEHLSSPGRFGRRLSSPTSLVGTDSAETLFFDTAAGASATDVYLWSPGATFSGNGFWETISDLPGAQATLTSVEPDFGPDHWLVSWTNSDPHGRPALVVFPPTSYQVDASVSPADVASGGAVTVEGFPSPSGVTWDNGQNPNALSAGTPVQVQFYNDAGNPAGYAVPMTYAGGAGTDQEHWTSPVWALPQNDSGSPQTYWAQVSAVDAFGATATSPLVSFTVEPQTKPAGGSQEDGTLQIQCYGTRALQKPHGPMACQFGDWIAGELQIPTPQPPKGLIDAQVTSVTLTAQMPYQRGWPNLQGYWGYNPSDPALFHYQTLTASFVPAPGQDAIQTSLELSPPIVVSWAGFPANQAPGYVYDSGDLTSDWTAVVRYRYEKRVPPYSFCVSPLPTGEAPNCDIGTTHAGVLEKQANYQQETGSYTESGSASAPYQITGSDWYIITTPYN